MGFITEKGVLTYKSQVETGTSKSGNTWQKQTIVVSRENVNAPYDKVALSVFGDKVNDSERCRVGDKVEITYSISVTVAETADKNLIRYCRCPPIGIANCVVFT